MRFRGATAVPSEIVVFGSDRQLASAITGGPSIAGSAAKASSPAPRSITEGGSTHHGRSESDVDWRKRVEEIRDGRTARIRAAALDELSKDPDLPTESIADMARTDSAWRNRALATSALLARLESDPEVDLILAQIEDTDQNEQVRELARQRHPADSDGDGGG